MRKTSLNTCPICGEELEIIELRCKKCGTLIRGRFKPCEFCELGEQHMQFLRTFLRARGNLSEVAKRMGISHPTARQRLKDLLMALGYEIYEIQEEESRWETLDLLERGEITVDEAIERLKRS